MLTFIEKQAHLLVILSILLFLALIGVISLVTHELTEAERENEKLTQQLRDETFRSTQIEKQLIYTNFQYQSLMDASQSLEYQAEKLDKELIKTEKELVKTEKEVKKLKTEAKKPPAKKPVSVIEKPKAETVIRMKSTAYTATCKGCSGITRTGINLLKNPDMKVIAVDPTVIPLGSKVYVEGYGNAVAGDTGGAIKGNKIDVFIPTYGEAIKYGVRDVDVQILSRGK